MLRNAYLWSTGHMQRGFIYGGYNNIVYHTEIKREQQRGGEIVNK